MGLASLMKSVSFIRRTNRMVVNGLVVHHKSNVYRLYHPNGMVIADIRFPNHGDTIEEARIIKIIIKHLKNVYGIDS